MVRDFVYPLAHQTNHEELRYSLRSLSNIAHGKVFLGGHIPDWAINIVATPRKKEGISRHKDAFLNVRQQLDNPELGEELVIMNDDFFILKPIAEIPIYRGREVGYSTWRGASEATLKMMKKFGCWSGASYEQHLPFLCEKSKLIYVMDRIMEEAEDYGRVYWRTVYGNYYRIKGEQTQDVKVRINPKVLPGQMFISSEDTTFARHIGLYLQELFPEKSIYEK